MNITKDFFGDNKVKKFDPWQRQFNSWATLMVNTGKAKEAKAMPNSFRLQTLYALYSSCLVDCFMSGWCNKSFVLYTVSAAVVMLSVS